MIFTTAGMLNKWGTPSTTGVGVGNYRIKNRRAGHKMYKTLCELTNVNTPKGPISETFNINNSDSWYVSYPDNPSLNFTISTSPKLYFLSRAGLEFSFSYTSFAKSQAAPFGAVHRWPVPGPPSSPAWPAAPELRSFRDPR